MKAIFAAFILSALCLVNTAYASAKYVDITIDDKIDVTESQPFGSYTHFFSTLDTPALISFTYFANDTCVITDYLGYKIELSSNAYHTISEVYFPITIWDEEDNNTCDGVDYTDITLSVYSIQNYKDTKQVSIDQNNHFSYTYFPELAGMNVNATIDAVFFKNFQQMNCLQVAVYDKNGTVYTIDNQDTGTTMLNVALPITVEYSGTCLTSVLPSNLKENTDFDVKFDLTIMLN